MKAQRQTVLNDYYIYNQPYYQENEQRYKKLTRRKIKPKRKINFFAFLFACLLLGLWSCYVFPYTFDNILRPLYVNRILNRNIKFDVKNYVYPTYKYLANSYLLDTPLIVPRRENVKNFAHIRVLGEFSSTKAKLLELFKKYPNLTPAVFVWEYSSGKGIEINADVPYASASIIKIPIAFELMRLIDFSSTTQNPITLKDKRKYTDEFKTEGSGKLQYSQSNVDYTLDHLANIMITNSDNSATNMLLYEIGGIDGFNRDMRNIGLKTTSMGGWLPDIEGRNKTTAREMSTILYNINNPNYVPVKYNNVLKEYLGNTKNTHLLKEKLPVDAMVLHKTGNIGKMLGDSGIIYTGNGKKYIVTILVKRPKNDYNAKLLIQDASLIIYNDINSL